MYNKLIHLLLLSYVDLIEQSNSFGRTDEAINAENLFCTFLNKLFGWKLINANAFNKNQDSYDLIDTKKKLAIQITSNKKFTTKLNNTITSFKRNPENRKIKKLIIFFIAKKCPSKILKSGIEENFTYEIYDIQKLYGKILYDSRITTDKLKYLIQILQEATLPVLENPAFPVMNKVDIHEILPIQSILINKNGIYIERKTLVEDIFSFIQIANGILVGGPGVGKSFTIEQLQKLCKIKKVPCFIVRINELLYATDDELNKEFKTNGYWINAFKKIPIKDGFKGILIFDAFDTAKDEKLKSAVLKQIKDAIFELKAKWNILVSARTFDVAKSSRLLELFPQINQIKPLSCRYIEIPELSEYEFDLAIKKNRKIYSIVQQSTKELRALLRIPYFFKLLEKIVIIGNNNKTEILINIETEEQLLEAYWNLRVDDDTNKDVFLRTLTNKLILKENLSCPKGGIITDLNSAVYDDLFSLNIISENSTTKQNISFSHNILLEFAVSKYLIPEEPRVLLEYISNNPKVPFLFRQSFIYFYSKLWEDENAIFWEHYFLIRTINTPLCRLYHQTILNYILAGYYKTIKDLTPVFQLNNIHERSNTIRKILEGIRFICKDKLRDKDFLLLLEVSNYINEFFLWELGFLISKSIKAILEPPNKKNLATISNASFKYLDFVLKEREISPNKALIEMNGGQWGIENIIDIFSTNKSGYSKLIKRILGILKEEDFPIRFFSVLIKDLPSIFNQDKQLAILIYKTLYYHNENSNKETYLGSGVIMALRSNRRQDFEGIHYRLEQIYKELLPLSPEEMIPMGIEIVNKLNDRKYYGTTKTPFHLLINGIHATLISDYSSYSSDHDKEYGPKSHAENIFKFLENEFSSKKTIKNSHLIKLVIQNAEVSLLWRKLINLFIKYPSSFKKEALGLLSNTSIFICDETIYEAGELIKILWSSISITQKKNIERTILLIKTSGIKNYEGDFLDRRIGRLLSCIPFKELNFNESREVIKTNGAQDNKSLANHRAVVRSYDPTTEEKMAQLGVNSTNKFEANLYKSIEKFELFNSKYDNNSGVKPSKEELMLLLEIAKNLYDISKSHIFSNARLKSSCDYEICRYVKLLVRHGKLIKSLREFIQALGFYYVKSIEYQSIKYEKGQINNRFGGVINARLNAVDILLELLYSDKSGIIAPEILQLMGDNTQIIRFTTLNSLNYYWHHQRAEFWNKIEERCEFEKDGMCLVQILSNICYDDIIKDNKDGVENIASVIIKKLNDVDDEVPQELWSIYIILLLKLVINHNSDVAINIIYSNLNIKSFVRLLIFEILTVIDPHDGKNDYIKSPAKYENLILVLQKILDFRFNSLRVNGIKSDLAQDNFEIIDTCIQHLYFTIQQGKKENKGKNILFDTKIIFFNKIKPILNFVVDQSEMIESGFMVAHTGYCFMQLLNIVFSLDPEYVLTMSSSIVKCAAANSFTYDQSTLGEVIKLTEKILADHKELLSKEEHFNSLIAMLDSFANSGWQEALELTWRLKEFF